MGLMNLMVKVGLLSYTEDDLAHMTPEERAKVVGQAVPETPLEITIVETLPPPVVVPESDIPEGVDLTTIYAEASIGSSPYPVEKFIKFIDALSALDDNSKRQAIVAMDAADDTWSVDDIANDLKAKKAALVQYQLDVQTTVTQMETYTAQKVASTQQESDARVQTLREQMAALEQQIQSEFAVASAAMSDLRTKFENNRAAGEREKFRITGIVQKFDGLEKTFFSGPVAS